MHEPIFKASLRLFFLVLSAVLGIFAGFILLALLIGSATDKTGGEPDITYTYEPKLIANAKNERKLLSASYPVILKVNISGEIGTESFNRKTIEQMLVESRERAFKNDRVKAILLYINTPGGTVTDSNSIYRMLKSYKEEYKTPIYAYVDGLCASGGMYVACAADKIYTSDASIIGSVGVLLGPFMNVYKLMEKLGVKSETITAGKNKDEMNPFREWKTNEGEDFRELTEYFYEHFINIVVANRPKLSRELLKEEIGARVFTAKAAEEYGFIDGSDHSMNQTLTMLAKEIGIDDEMYQVVEFESNNWLTSLLKGKINLNLLTGEIKHSLNLPPQLNPEFMNQPLYLYKPE